MLRLVRVEGDSMSPALRDGDVVVVRWGGRPRQGAVVVASFADAPGVFVVKRIDRIDSAGCWLAGDNADASDDSRSRGPVAAVSGRVLFRLPRQPRASSS